MIGTRRASWRVISTVERKETNAEKIELILNYKADIEKELEDICADIIGTSRSLLSLFRTHHPSIITLLLFVLFLSGHSYLSDTSFSNRGRQSVLLQDER